MRQAFRVTWRSLQDTWQEWAVLVRANLLALALCLPIVTGPPALAGLHNLGFFITHEKQVEFKFFWQGFKDYFLDSWKLTALNGLVFGVLGVDVWFYLFRMQGAWRLLGFVGLWMLFIWAVAQLYTFPLLVRQQERKLFLASRNAVLLTLAYPGFSLTAALLLAVLMALSLVLSPVFILLGLSFAAVMGAHTLRQGIERAEADQSRPDGGNHSDR